MTDSREHRDHHEHDGDHCPPCFAQGTRLRMVDGSTKAVEDIQVGDVLDTVSGLNGEVLWVGSSIEHDSMYGIYHPSFGPQVIVTKNHGVAVGLLDGSRALAAAKFLADADYGDFMVVRHVGTNTRVYHVLLRAHELVVTEQGLISESYFCGGWEVLPDAQAAFEAATGRSETTLTALPRLRKRDMDQVIDIKVDQVRAAAA